MSFDESTAGITRTQMNLDFHMREFDALRGEILQQTSMIEAMEQQCLLAIVAIFAWTLVQAASSQVNPLLAGAAALLPLVVVHIYLLRILTHREIIKLLSDYILNIEENVGLPVVDVKSDCMSNYLGWEHYYICKKEGNVTFRAGWRWKAYYIGSLLGAGLIFLVVYLRSSVSVPTAM